MTRNEPTDENNIIQLPPTPLRTYSHSSSKIRNPVRLIGDISWFLSGIGFARETLDYYGETTDWEKAMINSETTVKEVALDIPESTRLFEKLKIDYCCGGNQPLAEACSSAGLDVVTVMEMLDEVAKSSSPAATAWDRQNAPLPQLIEHILNTHHVFTKSEINRLEALTEKVIGVHGQNHPELVKVGELFKQLSGDLNPHMFKEEQVLFPYILAMSEAAAQNQPCPPAFFGTVNNPVRMMMKEHDTAGQILRELRAVTSDYELPADACISYQTLYRALENLETDLHQHIHLENNLLFPKALDLENALNG